MQSFLCRVMAFVFILNCLLPSPQVWAQTPSQQDMAAAIEKGVEKSVAQQAADSVEQALEALYMAEGVDEIKDAIVNMHNVMDKKYAQDKKEEETRRYREQAMQRGLTQQPDVLYVQRPVAPVPMAKNEVLVRLAKDDVMLDTLVEYIDPFDPEKVNLQNITYASEIFGNSLDAFLMQPDEFTVMQLNSFMPFAQLRTLYRLNKIAPMASSSIQGIMALGSLRITLWKMHTYYTKTGQQDPLLQPQGDQSGAEISFAEGNDQPKRMTVTNAAQSSFKLPSDVYAQINSQFLAELSALKGKDPKEGDAEYQRLLVLADYAVTYAWLTNPQQVVKIVKLFDEGTKRDLKGNVKAGKFLQPYSSVLNAIFTATFENVKYMTPDSGTWNQALSMLKDFSDPEKYSLPTRIFALEAASLLYRSAGSCDAAQAGQAPSYPVFVQCNSGEPNEKLRPVFAKRTVDLYAPLTRTHYIAIDDYGLDSKQMQMLADKLAYIYNGFANDDLKWNAELAKNANVVAVNFKQNGQSFILNGANSIPRVQPANRPYMYQVPNGQVKYVGGFGRNSEGLWVPMELSNGLNAKKVSDEYSGQFFAFVGNAIFWIYGGEIFAWLGTAYRTTKGAMIALPKAVKAARAANKGRRSLAFGVEIQKSVRFANLSRNLTKNGAVMAVDRTVDLNIPGVTPKQNIKIVTNQRALKNQYSRLNPKRWLGLRPPKITRISFQQMQPGFKTVQGTVDVSKTALSGGLKNWDDWRKVRGAFASTEDGVTHVFPKFFDFPTRKAIFQEARLVQTMDQAARNGGLDLWVPVKTPAFTPTAQQPAVSVAGESFLNQASDVTWWNWTRLGQPGNRIAWKDVKEVFITPAVSKEAAKQIMDPATLSNAVKMPLEKITSQQWQQELIGHYFTKMNRQGISRYLLPEYVPNANFWQEAVSNWRFGLPAGKEFLSNTRFWKGWPVIGIEGSGFKSNLIFFGAWGVLDEGLYPLSKSWMANKATEEHAREQQRYADAFDAQKLKEDEAAMSQLAGNSLQNAPQMSALDDVRATQRDQAEGTLITFPIFATRNELIPEGAWGHLPFVSEQDKELYRMSAARIQLNRAMREQTKTIMQKTQAQQAEYEKMMQEQQAQAETYRESAVQAWKDIITQQRQYYWDMLSAKGMETYRKEVDALFQNYWDDVMKVYSTDELPMVQEQKALDVNNQYSEKLMGLLEEARDMEEMLYDKQQKAVEEEEYDLDLDDLLNDGSQVPGN